MFAKILALTLQVGSLIVFIFLWSFRFMSFEVTGLRFLYRLRPMIALPLCLVFFSLIWTNKFQEWKHKRTPERERERKSPNLAGHTARYKSCKLFQIHVHA